MAIPTEGLKTDARLSFLRLDAAGRERSREAWRMLESELPAVLDAFYAHLARTPALTPLFAGHDMTRLKRAQAAHWKALFTGGIDAEFLERVRRIGEAHHRIGLDPRWYFGAYNFVLTEIGRILAAKIPRDARRVEMLMASVRACVFLDMDLSFEVYGAVAREHAHALVQSVAQTFEATVRGAISSFDDVASRVGVTTENAERGIAQAGQDSRSAADAAVVTAGRVQAVASASEELTASIASVAAQVTQVADAAGTARGASDLSRGTVAGLSATIDRIGGALKLIGTIASQTNLLALNATIEAARAGEAGKGFAVVAGEVKTLAGQTARATQEIADLLTEIRSGAERMSDGIGQTDRAVSVLETCTGAALGAIREQQVATTEIASNILAGADAVGGISHRITAVSGELGALHGTVSAASEAGRELSAGAAALHAALETFLTGLNDLRRAV